MHTLNSHGQALLEYQYQNYASQRLEILSVFKYCQCLGIATPHSKVSDSMFPN